MKEPMEPVEPDEKEYHAWQEKQAANGNTALSDCSVFDKYRNPDPRCGYPFTPDPCGYCWSYARHIDGTGCKDMDEICPRCEMWTPNA